MKSVESTCQAVIVLGNEDGHAWPAITQREHPVHAELVCDRAKRSIEIAQVQAEAVEIPFDASQVKAILAGLMLLEVENVAVVAIDEFGNGGVQSLAVRTLHKQDRGVFHGGLSPENRHHCSEERGQCKGSEGQVTKIR
jgi:hypothetical protein